MAPLLIDKVDRQAAPRLHIVQPLTHKIMCLFVTFNFVMAAYFFFGPNPYPSAVLNQYIGMHVWGAVFTAVGVLMAIGLFTNDWITMRRSMMLGVVVKSFWAYALIVSMIHAGTRLLGVVAMWLLILAIQAATVIYFAPKTNALEKDVGIST